MKIDKDSFFIGSFCTFVLLMLIFAVILTEGFISKGFLKQMSFLEGNLLKYLWRYKEKNGVADLKKAKVYLEKLISEVEKSEKA